MILKIVDDIGDIFRPFRRMYITKDILSKKNLVVMLCNLISYEILEKTRLFVAQALLNRWLKTWKDAM